MLEREAQEHYSLSFSSHKHTHTHTHQEHQEHTQKKQPTTTSKQKINFDEMMKTSLADDTSSDSDYGEVMEDGLDALDDWGDVAENVVDDDDDDDKELLKSVSIMSSIKLEKTLSSIKSKQREKSLELERNNKSSKTHDSASSSEMNMWLSKQSDDVRDAAQIFLKTHESEVCLEMLCHVAETSGVSEKTFVQFLESFEIQNYAEGETIVKRGVQVKGWYMITEGHVEVAESTTKIHLHEGNCFGTYSHTHLLTYLLTYTNTNNNNTGTPALLRGKNGGLGLFGRGDGISVTSSTRPHCILAVVSRKRFLELLDSDKGLSEFFHNHAETQIKMRKKRKSYQNKRRNSRNLPHTKQIKHTQATAKTTRRAKFTRTNSGHRMVNKYKILSRLGRGAYGDVRKCEDTVTKHVYAVKIVNRSQLRGGGGRSAAESSQFQQLELEVKILRELRHPNVVLLHEVIDDDTVGKLYIIQEFVQNGSVMPEELFAKPLEPQRVWRLFRDMLRGLEYLHQHLVIHRDLKPSNILIDSEDCAKIADFGMASSLQRGDDLADAETAGSPAFMAPEVCGLMGNEPYSGQRADMWSAGATLFAMLFGHPPYIQKNLTLLEQFEAKLLPLKFPNRPKGMSFEDWAHCQDLLRKMLDKNWRHRLNLKNVKVHEYITKQGTKKLHQLEYQYGGE